MRVRGLFIFHYRARVLLPNLKRAFYGVFVQVAKNAEPASRFETGSMIME